ncbi:penicillin-binding transpeptidase domain-containing protein [Alkalihalobacillus sp. AL-G]|uniref:penicillin-binding transpeptidase domain-containing protein n=1 Tax=Alkalihalobacillus sp. AL-G TaxID=2926399 RepID=UPI00272B5D36|nr:penicillin-binding transpeptidase domain-containing protein [Alkalihalobacillus sp. AL-G]WLD93117.1 penicillin-binding transpeptidase domain-containing protein [Alkalihalobacillus sp. AL-G]
MLSRKILAAIILMTVFILAGCSEQPKPETTFKDYMDAWEKQDFDQMYSLLSKDSQQQIDKEKFVERYTQIYEGIEMSNLSIAYKLPEEDKEYKEEDIVSFEFGVKMDTLAGPLEINHESKLIFEKTDEETSRWAMTWSPSMIFPGMKEGDTISADTIAPERGEMFDVNGVGLAINGEVIEVGLVPEWMQADREQMKQELSQLIDLPVEEINAALDQEWVKSNSYVPLKSMSALDYEKVETVKALNGTKLVRKQGRVYPLGPAAAHLTGYLGPITEKQLESWKDKSYTANSIVGRAGLELVYEEKLRGEYGGEIFIKDPEGNNKKTLAENEPIPGEDLMLTVDSSIQAAIYNQMWEDAGTAAAFDPTTGEVKGLVSTPAYDPNQFIYGVSVAQYNEWVNDTRKPLTNRFSKTYAPGSTFKPITAAIGLETGAIDPAKERSIEGSTWKKDSSWGNYAVKRVSTADSSVNLRDALVRSDNIYFAQSILDIGGKTFLKEAKDFGFGQEISFGYPITPSQIAGENGFEGEIQLANTGYGQGKVEMSALHLGLTYTPFITKGTMLKPVLFKEKETGKPWKENVISEEIASMITKDLTDVVNTPIGTAYEPKVEGLQLAGKTGTAELKIVQGEKGKENGWFVAWNTNDPKLLISMMIENVQDKGGSHYVVPKVKNVFKAMLSQ